MTYFKYANHAERIRRNVVVDDFGCWIWTGLLTEAGYGRLSAGQRQWKAHRLSYETFVGPIPDGLTLDHLCRVRACVNPAHLDPCTLGVNTARSPLAISSINAAKTECKRGHPFDEQNTYRQPSRGSRKCLTCRDEYWQRWYAKRKSA